MIDNYRNQTLVAFENNKRTLMCERFLKETKPIVYPRGEVDIVQKRAGKTVLI